jgi:hypothetical protein
LLFNHLVGTLPIPSHWKLPPMFYPSDSGHFFLSFPISLSL